MMDTNKMREEFEAWQAKETPGSDLLRIGKNEESYRNMYVAERWIGWQASRESLVVELPDPFWPGYVEDDEPGFCISTNLFTIEQITEALADQGIRTK